MYLCKNDYHGEMSFQSKDKRCLVFGMQLH